LLTLLFTDLVGSTALKQQLGDHAGVASVQQHHTLMRQLLNQFRQAEEISTAGDSFFLVFANPSDGVRFALLLQSRLCRFNQGRSVPLQDRVGLHLGEVVVEEKGAGKWDLYGIQVDTCARVMSLAQAGQILMTRPVFDNARQSLKGEEVKSVGSLTWLNHGRFELKGVEELVEICEVRAGDSAALFPPKATEKARRLESAEGEAVLGWRPGGGADGAEHSVGIGRETRRGWLWRGVARPASKAQGTARIQVLFQGGPGALAEAGNDPVPIDQGTHRRPPEHRCAA
jgi:class 3 adenylate cyclase